MNAHSLAVNVSSVSGRHKNIGSLSGHIYSPNMHALLALSLTMPARLIGLAALIVAAFSTHAFLKWVYCKD